MQLSIGTLMCSTLRHSMSPGSQRRRVLVVKMAMKHTGVLSIRIGTKSSPISLAPTPPSLATYGTVILRRGCRVLGAKSQA